MGRKDEQQYEKSMFTICLQECVTGKAFCHSLGHQCFIQKCHKQFCRGTNSSVSPSKLPCLDWPTLFPLIVLSFGPQTLLTGFYPLPLGTWETKTTKTKIKGREITGNSFQSRLAHSLGIRIYLPFLSYSLRRFPYVIFLPTCYILKKKTERKIFIIGENITIQYSEVKQKQGKSNQHGAFTG